MHRCVRGTGLAAAARTLCATRVCVWCANSDRRRLLGPVARLVGDHQARHEGSHDCLSWASSAGERSRCS